MAKARFSAMAMPLMARQPCYTVCSNLIGQVKRWNAVHPLSGLGAVPGVLQTHQTELQIASCETWGGLHLTGKLHCHQLQVCDSEQPSGPC